MGNSYLINPIVFLLQTVLGFYISILLLRFLLQLVRADFQNPVSQMVVTLTSPVLRRLRRYIPGLAGLDLASLLLAWVLKALELTLLMLILGLGFYPLAALFWAIPELVELVINIFLIAIIIQVIFSWIGQGGYNPIENAAYSISYPVMSWVEEIIPPVSGLDFSPMVASVMLVLLKMLLIPVLRVAVGSPL
ncbi:membrane protein [Achromatium sp. WMS2]|nr:membrane protein [Achromatium sp. WMS2]